MFPMSDEPPSAPRSASVGIGRPSAAEFDANRVVITGLFTMLVSEIIGAERAPVEIIRDGNRRVINIGRKINGEIEMLAGAEPGEPVTITNSKYWMGPNIVAARGVKSKVRDYGRVWDFGGKSAEVCAIDWQGAR